MSAVVNKCHSDVTFQLNYPGDLILDHKPLSCVINLHNYFSVYMSVCHRTLYYCTACFVFPRLFSDGGNFCPEEIDVFRKNLDKYSHKVDDAEGVVMSELEGIEAKWLKRANQLAVDFEDRYMCTRCYCLLLCIVF